MIHGYHYNRGNSDTTRDGGFFKTDRNGQIREVSASNAGSALYLGFELETDDYGDDDPEYVSDIVDDMRGSYCHCEHDGSLENGFEIVTQPMTLAAHKAAGWGEMLSEISDRGGHSHETNTCGLHVHVSRAALGTTDDARVACIGKILELLERFQREFSCIARREIYGNEWACETGYGHCLDDGTRDIRRKANRIQYEQGLGYHDTRRYRALNLQNRNTIEFRFFRGTLSTAALYATLTLVDGLVRWCKTHTTPETHAVSWYGLLTWINDPVLNSYWSNRSSDLYRYTAYCAA